MSNPSAPEHWLGPGSTKPLFAARHGSAYSAIMKAMRVQTTVMARDLPEAWREEGRFAPDQRVTVVIEPEDRELAAAASLEVIMDIVSRRAKERGLTEERFAETVNEP